MTLTLGIGTVALSPIDVDAALEPMPAPLARALASQPREARAQLPDGLWLALERDGSSLKLIEDRDNGAVLRRWPLTPARRWASLSLLPSGRVLIWGGVDPHQRPQTSGIWFDPDSRTLSPAIGLTLSPRTGHAATVLSDGRLLITGGWLPGHFGVAQAELWDERGVSPHVTEGQLAPVRLGHRSRIEADGRVRLFEGVDPQGRKLAQEQLYDPQHQRFTAAPARTDVAAVARTQPRLVAAAPAHLARGVATDARLSLRFSEPLHAAELNRASVTLLGPRGFVAVQVTPAEAGRLLFVTPRHPLLPEAEYSLLVDGVHARNGQALAPTLIDFANAAATATRASSASSSDPVETGPIASRTIAASIRPIAAPVTPKVAKAADDLPTLSVDTARVRATLSTEFTERPELGAARTVRLREGQDAYLNFHGDADQRLTLSVSGQTTAPAGHSVQYTARKLDGSPLF